MDDDRSILKRGAKRTLWMRPGHGPHGDVVVKRFHAPGIFDRWRDSSRAEGERRTLAALHARGLPVPEPLAVERHHEGVDLVMRSIEGARSLSVLVRERPSAMNVAGITREVGVLLARAALCGLRHPDLHAGNLLVDASHRAWLVDLRGARLGGAFAWSEHERALVVLAADVRERTSVRERLRVLIASLRFLERAGIDALPNVRALALRIEHDARVRRRTILARASGRWLRASSVTALIERAHRDGIEHGWRARGADEERCWRALDEPGLHPLVAGSARSVEAVWRTAVRLHEHGIASPAPLAIVCAGRARGDTEPRARAVFGSFADDLSITRNLTDIERDRVARAAAARGLGTLLGTMFDRGLGFATPLGSSVTFDADGHASAAVAARVRAVDIDDPDAALRSTGEIAARATRMERARFLVAWSRAQASPTTERERLRAGVGRG